MKCHGRTLNGTTCARQTTSKRYCWQHVGGGSIQKPKTFSRPKLNSWEIYGSSSCPWTINAVDLLSRNKKIKLFFYDMNIIWPGKDFYLAKEKLLVGLRDLFGGRDHHTMPIIFDDQNRFVGGFTDLERRLK